MGSGVRPDDPNLSQPICLPAEDNRPIVFVLPAVFAVGGVERNTVEIMRALNARYRFVVVTNEYHLAERGSLHHQLSGVVEDVYDLAEIAPPSRHLALLRRLALDYGVSCFWICNGSTWLVENAVALRAAFPQVPIVDQQAYDTEQGWIAHFHNPGIQSFDRFIAVNARIRDVFIGRYGIPAKRVDLIYSAIDTSRFSGEISPDRGERFRRQYDIPDGVQVFAQIGRLHEQKRPEDFVELSRRSQEAGFSDIFLLIGDGALAPKCREMVRRYDLHNIRIVPYCEDLTEVYAVISGLMITSAYEGLPIVALEAMAVGVPLIATDVGDIRSVLDDHGLGTIFGPVGDSEGLWRGFARWRTQLAERRAEAVRGSADVRRRFSSATIAEKYAQCFDRAAQDARCAARS
jgi:glycosyltransferase involved in cell wall biosynthesis